MKKRRSTRLDHDPQHHESCAVQIDPVLRCTCAREDAYDKRRAQEPANDPPNPLSGCLSREVAAGVMGITITEEPNPQEVTP